MFRKLFKPYGNPDVDAFLKRIARHDFRNYSDMDRYQDFGRVFLSSPQGERVLSQIFKLCGLTDPTAADPTAPPHMAFQREGKRLVAIEIMAILNAEPVYEEPKEIDDV